MEYQELTKSEADATQAACAAVTDALLLAGSPLHLACGYGHKDSVKVLLKHGADPLWQTKNGKLPIHLACYKGAWRSFEPLVAAGGSSMLNVPGPNGTPLLLAVSSGSLAAAHELLRLGAPVKQISGPFRQTATISVYMLRSWREEQRQPSERSGENQATSLAHRDVQRVAPSENQALAMVKLLLASGADPSVSV